MEYYASYASPIGQMRLVSDGENLSGLYFGDVPREDSLELFERVRLWLDAYFRGEKPEAQTLPLAPKGTEFQEKVWQILMDIPYGETRTYGDIAREMALLLGKEKMSARAVGGAVGRNPISIVIPCHRVVGPGGRLTGYAYGLEKKQWLLEKERGNDHQ